MTPSFDKNTGSINLTPELSIDRGMTRQDILEKAVNWESWNVIDGVASAYRTIIKLPHKNISSKTIVIVHVGTSNSPIAFWDIAPWDLASGVQSRPEGKYTKLTRKWFFDVFHVNLPFGSEWGYIDASYDHWNQSAGVVCNYREGFETHKEWSEFRRENKF